MRKRKKKQEEGICLDDTRLNLNGKVRNIYKFGCWYVDLAIQLPIYTFFDGISVWTFQFSLLLSFNVWHAWISTHMLEENEMEWNKTNMHTYYNLYLNKNITPLYQERGEKKSNTNYTNILMAHTQIIHHSTISHTEMRSMSPWTWLFCGFEVWYENGVGTIYGEKTTTTTTAAYIPNKTKTIQSEIKKKTEYIKTVEGEKSVYT